MGGFVSGACAVIEMLHAVPAALVTGARINSLRKFSGMTFFFFVFLFIVSPALADDYVKPSIDSMARTLVRFGALDPKDDNLLDDYAMITDCDLYAYFYKDDFRWNQVRGSFRDSITMNVGGFPVSYQYNTRFQLGRYDFDQKLFRFNNKSALRNVNSIVLLDANNVSCAGRRIRYLPGIYRAVLDIPLTVPGLPLSEKDADALSTRLKNSGNDDRIIYTRFNLSVAYVAPLRRAGEGEIIHYTQTAQNNGERAVRLDVRLDSLEFYEDEAMTKLIYSYHP